MSYHLCCIVLQMLEVAAICSSAQHPPGKLLCVQTPLVEQNTVSHWQELQTHHGVFHRVCPVKTKKLKSADMTFPPDFFFFFLFSTIPKHCCFPANISMEMQTEEHIFHWS